MIHSHIIEKNKTRTIWVSNLVATNTVDFEAYQLLEDLTYPSFPITSPAYQDNQIATSSITTPSEDCYLLIKSYLNTKLFSVEVLRIGEPTLKLFIYSEQDESSTMFKQYSKEGLLLVEDYVAPIGSSGFYMAPIVNQFDSLFEFKGKRELLKLPYVVVSTSGGSNGLVLADANFVDSSTFYATVGFTGDPNSYFDQNNNEWVSSTMVKARASDLSKAIAFKYNLSLIDPLAANFIGNYIGYFRIYDEEAGKFLVYVPGITPDSNTNNFELIVLDELNMNYVRGIQILLKDKLVTTPDGSEGIVIPFNNNGMVL